MTGRSCAKRRATIVGACVLLALGQAHAEAQTTAQPPPVAGAPDPAAVTPAGAPAGKPKMSNLEKAAVAAALFGAAVGAMKTLKQQKKNETAAPPQAPAAPAPA